MQQARSLMEQWQMLPPTGGRLLCAVSGGKDSVCLLHFLSHLAKEKGFSLAAAHFDHRLRGEESAGDAAFVRALCADWGIPCVVGEEDVAAEAARRRLGIEACARLCRYAFLERAAESLGASRIATAHHAEDNAETLLLHLARGSGLGGLGGMQPVRGRLVRPLLTTTREEIDAYAAANALPYREDSSNADIRLARNFLRREVMPRLRTLNPALTETLGRSMDVFREENALLDALAAEALGPVKTGEGWAACENGRFAAAAPALRPRMVLALLAQAHAPRKDLTARHLDAAVCLAVAGPVRGSLDLPGGLRVRRAGAALRVEKREEPLPETPLFPGESVLWGKYTIARAESGENIAKNSDTILLKYDMINLNVTVGPWRAETRLHLPGAPGPRSLKRLFADAGAAPPQREQTPVIYVGGRAAAVYGIGTDRAFLPGEGETALRITIEKNAREY